MSYTQPTMLSNPSTSSSHSGQPAGSMGNRIVTPHPRHIPIPDLLPASLPPLPRPIPIPDLLPASLPPLPRPIPIPDLLPASLPPTPASYLAPPGSPNRNPGLEPHPAIMSIKDLDHKGGFHGRLKTCWVFWLAQRQLISNLLKGNPEISHLHYENFAKEYKDAFEEVKSTTRQISYKIKNIEFNKELLEACIDNLTERQLKPKDQSIRNILIRAKQNFCNPETGLPNQESTHPQIVTDDPTAPDSFLPDLSSQPSLAPPPLPFPIFQFPENTGLEPLPDLTLLHPAVPPLEPSTNSSSSNKRPSQPLFSIENSQRQYFKKKPKKTIVIEDDSEGENISPPPSANGPPRKTISLSNPQSEPNAKSANIDWDRADKALEDLSSRPQTMFDPKKYTLSFELSYVLWLSVAKEIPFSNETEHRSKIFFHFTKKYQDIHKNESATAEIQSYPDIASELATVYLQLIIKKLETKDAEIKILINRALEILRNQPSGSSLRDY